VTNLAGTGGGLVLQDNGGDNLPVNANGNFTFATPIDSGGTYKVTVLTQPSSPAQTCGVTLGTGTATANTTNVAVDCGHNEWTWENGANVINQPGTYGTLGTAAPGNVPGARGGRDSWTDAAGNFWLFGGGGVSTAGTVGYFNDLWKYSAGEWTWMGGSNIANQPGTYGTLGTAAPGNVPGARFGGVNWTDATGDVWLFGGYGLDSAGTSEFLNDLWKYSAGEWTWIGGANVVDQPGTYGTLGTAAPGNVPGARSGAVGWTDTAGSFWLFGGFGFDSAGTKQFLNDLWKYSAGEWTWMGGSNLANQPGTYGTQGTPAPSNVPGARLFHVSWTDAAGNFWLFGGLGYDSVGNNSYLNDLWKYSAGEWTWVSGANLGNQTGTYGTLGTAAPSNVPGARNLVVIWTDAAGNFWLFGGEGYDSTGTDGFLNDLWKYSAGEWTWMRGSNIGNQTGTYGTQGRPAPGNVPAGRVEALGWTDAAGNFWLFGGSFASSSGTSEFFNDLWKYEP
jgi:N-acetylneuraminic acid mutarotase